MKSFSKPAKTVMIVEEQKLLADLLVEAITEETPYKVVCVSSGAQALHLVGSLHPDLLIVSDRLADLSGLALYDRIQEHMEHRIIPMILLRVHKRERGIGDRQIFELNLPFDLDALFGWIECLFWQGYSMSVCS